MLRLEHQTENYAATDKMDAENSEFPRFQNTIDHWGVTYLSIVAIADRRLRWPMLRRYRKLRVVVGRPPILIV